MNTQARIKEIMDIIERSDVSHVQDIQLNYEGYSEPGYRTPESGIIATGNWNDVTKYVNGNRITISDYPSRIASLFEKLGVEIEWSDEWTTCGSCSKLVRTSADSYGWQPSYVMYDGELECAECIAEHPEDHLESLEGNTNSCNTISSIDPTDHGYVKFNEDSYESGWYGVNDDPKKIAEILRAKGISRFLFQLDENQQFCSRFSVYVHSSETHLLNPPKPHIIDREHPIKMTMEEYVDHRENYDGFCLACGEAKEGGVEPDAESYICLECDSNSVMGIELALIAGLVTVDI